MKKKIYFFCNWFEFIVSSAGFIIVYILMNYSFSADIVLTDNVEYNKWLQEQKTILQNQIDNIKQYPAKTPKQNISDIQAQEDKTPVSPENAEKNVAINAEPVAKQVFYITETGENGEDIRKELTREEADRFLAMPEKPIKSPAPVSETQKTIAVFMILITIFSNIIGLYKANRGRYIVNTLLLPLKFIFAPFYIVISLLGFLFSLLSISHYAEAKKRRTVRREEELRQANLSAGLSSSCYYLVKRSVKPADERE